MRAQPRKSSHDDGPPGLRLYTASIRSDGAGSVPGSERPHRLGLGLDRREFAGPCDGGRAPRMGRSFPRPASRPAFEPPSAVGLERMVLGAETDEVGQFGLAALAVVESPMVTLQPEAFATAGHCADAVRTSSAISTQEAMARVGVVTVRMSNPSRTIYCMPPCERSSVAAATETGPMPSISHSSSPEVVPRRRAAASMTTTACGRAPLFAAPVSELLGPWSTDPQRRSRKASSRCASRLGASTAPLAERQRSAASFSRMGATRAQATSSQENSPRIPPPSS